MQNSPKFLRSKDAVTIYALIKSDCKIDVKELQKVTLDEQAFLLSEQYVRAARYGDIENDLPPTASSFAKSLAICTGFLFTSPTQALGVLDFLLPLANDADLQIRLRVWRMHLLLLTGERKVGIRLRTELE